MSGFKLVVGVVGIYIAFVYYGLLQEDVLTFTSKDGQKFTQAWFLQVLEAGANVIVGLIGRTLLGGVGGLPYELFALSGATQVTAKYCTSASTIYGLVRWNEGGWVVGWVGRVSIGCVMCGSARSLWVCEGLMRGARVGRGASPCVLQVCLCGLCGRRQAAGVSPMPPMVRVVWPP